jgi:general secretion pathway protein G
MGNTSLDTPAGPEQWSNENGFSMIELIVVLAIVGVLLTLAIPRFGTSISFTKEAVLKENLVTMRRAIDQYYADTGQYPKSLPQLVEMRYLRDVPVDPVVERADAWILVAKGQELIEGARTNTAADRAEAKSPTLEIQEGFHDVRSGSALVARDGTKYAQW